jgi:hypothetical protein
MFMITERIATRHLLAAVLAVGCIAGASAAPVVNAITGVPADGATITISGTGFGTKNRAAPLVFDDFESGAVGTPVAGSRGDSGAWNTGSWSSGVTYSATSPVSGSRSARHAFGGGVYNASLYVDPSATQTVYLDFWIRAVPKDAKSRNWKTWRFYDSSDSERGNDVYYCDSAGAAGLDPPWVYKTRDFVAGQWAHYEVVARYGANGRFVQYRDGVLDARVTGFSNSASVTQIRIGHYWALDGVAGCGSNSGADVYTDLVYVDSSLARVMIGDAPTFEQSRQRAIQLPATWSDSQISVTVSTPRFSSGSRAYLFVIDANDEPSVGYPITIGTASIQPKAPTGVTAQ